MKEDRILIVDDEEDILELVRYNLTKDGYKTLCVTSGEDCLRTAQDERPNLILDLMLPGVSGLEVCSRLKADAALRNIPIVMLSAKGEESDIVTGLELGADDYITKPFIPRILIARVRAVLRRQHAPIDQERLPNLSFDGLLIDQLRHEVKLEGQPIELTATEFKLLSNLAQQPGRVFTRTQIVKAIHGPNYPVTDRSIDVQVVGLRRKMARFGALIETVRGVGYRFRDSETYNA